MLKANQFHDELSVFAKDAVKGVGCVYICPSCGDKVVLKKGAIKIPHFSHPRENNLNKLCTLKSSSALLDKWAYEILTAFEPNEVEVPKGGFIMDILIKDSIGISLAYIEHMMYNKGLVPIMEEHFKAYKYVKQFMVLLNMSDEFKMVEKDNELVWLDRYAVEQDIIPKSFGDMVICIYNEGKFYLVERHSEDFSRFLYINRFDDVQSFISHLKK
ncbi:MAG: competence protein CoiA family protein [Cetobacterium sp.]